MPLENRNTARLQTLSKTPHEKTRRRHNPKGVSPMSVKTRPIGPNQTEVSVGDKTLFFSYETLVALNMNGKFYRTNERYSVTTSKHINRWLSGAKADEVSQAELEKLAE
jgi:hypothetical protein